WQYPHCTTSRSNHACCTFLPAGVSPIASMVVIFLPVAAATGVTHERIGWPSSCTVHAPHSAMPQPNFVPVRPTTSRSAQRSGISGGTSTVWSLPLMLRVIMLGWSSGLHVHTGCNAEGTDRSTSAILHVGINSVVGAHADRRRDPGIRGPADQWPLPGSRTHRISPSGSATYCRA